MENVSTSRGAFKTLAAPFLCLNKILLYRLEYDFIFSMLNQECSRGTIKI